MKTKAGLQLAAFSVLVLLTSVVSAAPDDSLCNAVCRTIRGIREQSPNVVLISVPGSGDKGESGTGTVISYDGGIYILTNNHVVERAASGRVWVTFESRKHAEVDIVGRDPVADLALVTAPELPRGVVSVKFGERLEDGQQVYALGYPFGSRSITFGYINTLEPVTWPFVWTQTPLNPGNSGGPLFNERREMVGVNTAVIPANIAIGGGISLVIPIDHVKRLLGRLARERVVRHGFAGFVFRDSTDILPIFFERHGLRYPPSRHGIMIVGVLPGSPAVQANLSVGDIILEWNGGVLADDRRLREKIFFDHRPGDEVAVTIWRDNQTFKRTIRLGEHSSPKKGKQDNGGN